MEIAVEIAIGDDDDHLAGGRRISDEAGRANPRRRVRREVDEPYIGHHLHRPGRLDVERTRVPTREGPDVGGVFVRPVQPHSAISSPRPCRAAPAAAEPRCSSTWPPWSRT